MQKASELMVLDKILVRVKFVSRILNLCFKVGKEPRLCVNLVHSGGPNDTASVFDSFDCKNWDVSISKMQTVGLHMQQ